MPAQPPPEDQFAQFLAALLALYFNAESSLLGGIAGILRFTTPDVLGQLMALQKMRRLTQRVNLQLTAGTSQYVGPLIEAAAAAGAQAPTGTDMVRRGQVSLHETPFDFSMSHGDRAVQAIRADLVSSLEDVRRRITRLPDDVYKVISPAVAAGQVVGRGYTPAQAQAFGWREFVSQGVRGFTDRAGRDWSLSAYVEMSVRTASMRAFNTSHLQVIQATGENLVVVSDDGHPCPLCFPWQNRVCCIVPDGIHPSVADAIAAGLMHPNCKHVWSIYIPGVTQLPARREWSEQDALDYRNTQKQRRIELEIRKAKRALEYSTHPDTAARARADVRREQARMRAFIKETGFLRYSRREQLDLADAKLKLPQ